MNAGMEPISAAITRFVRTHEEVTAVRVQEDIGPRELEDLVWVSCPITLVLHIFCYWFYLCFLQFICAFNSSILFEDCSM